MLVDVLVYVLKGWLDYLQVWRAKVEGSAGESTLSLTCVVNDCFPNTES